MAFGGGQASQSPGPAPSPPHHPQHGPVHKWGWARGHGHEATNGVGGGRMMAFWEIMIGGIQFKPLK